EPAGRTPTHEPIELVPGKGDEQTEDQDHRQGGRQSLRPQTRAHVLDEDGVIEPVADPLPHHHDDSLDPTLMNSSSRLSRRRVKLETRTPCRTRLASRSLAASASPRNRNSYVCLCFLSTGPARSSVPMIQRNNSGSESTSTDKSESPMIRRLTSSIRP